ncbi:GGDEF domain-containing protein [bacterium]|nr:GGDEF domain-containing protein [bacterium]
MSDEFKPLDADITYLTLSYATRMLASETNLDELIRISLVTIADFAHSDQVEFQSIDWESGISTILGIYEKGETRMHGESINFKEAPLEQLIESRQLGKLISVDGTEKLFLPLVGSNNSMIGLISLNLDNDKPLLELEMQILVILSTLIAVSLENTKFYRLAMFDGLTALYVRREFDARLAEEMARIYRYGGNLSIFLADIDNFKHFNDTYGHLQGDMVLQELAGILKDSLRRDVDIACRFGGEELVVILPNSDAEAAYNLAERFRQKCEEFDFPGQSKPLKVTVSVGVASINKEVHLTKENFISTAEKMLNKAKETGRNCVKSWDGE